MTSLPNLFSYRKSKGQTNSNAAAAAAAAVVVRSDNVKIVHHKNRNALDSKNMEFASPQLHHSSCNASSKSIRRKVNPKDMKLVNSPSSVLCYPRSSSPASSIHEERKFISQSATTSSSAGTKRKIKSLAPKTRFIGEELRSMQDRFRGRSSNLSPCVSAGNCLKVGRSLTTRKLSSSCSKLKPDRQIPKQNLKNRMMSLKQKRQKDDHGLFQAEKENVVFDIEKDVVEVKGPQIHLSFIDDNLQVVDLYKEDDHSIPFLYHEDLPLTAIFDNVNEDVQSKPRRQSFLRKSLAWDRAFLTSAGLLSPEELCMINKGFKMTQKDGQISKDATKSQSNAPSCKKMNICSQNKVKSVGALKSQRPNLQGRTTEQRDKLSKLSSSNNNAAALGGSENFETKNKTRTAQDSKRSRLGGRPKSTSFTSPTTANFNQSSSSAASASAAPKRKMKSSALRMPSSKTGFFDEELGSMQDHFGGHSNEFQSSNLSPGNCLNVGKDLRTRKVGSSCSKAPKQILKNVMISLDPKRQKDDRGSVQDEKDMVEVKGQQIHLSFEDDNLQLVHLYEEDDHLIPFPYCDTRKDLRLSAIFDNVNEDFESKPRRQSFLRKSLAWDSAILTGAGLLNREEFFMINEGFKRTQKDDQRSKDATKNGGSQFNVSSCKKTNLCSQNKVRSVGALKSQSPNLQGKITDHQKRNPSYNNAAAVEGSRNAKIRNKTRTAQDSKRSQSGGLPKSPSFTSSTTINLHQSSSSASSKNLSKMKVNPKSKKLINSPSSVLHFPLSSSPASSVDSWLSESSFPTTMTRQNTIPVSDFQGQNSEESKFISQNATKETARGPKKPSGLRMPSPRIGFFDKEPRSMQGLSSNISPCVSSGNFSKVGNIFNSEHDERKVGSSCSKLKSYEKIPKQTLKMNLDQKDDYDSFQAKEHACSFEDRVNDLSRQLEAVDLETDVIQVGGQRIYEVLQPGQPSVLATA